MPIHGNLNPETSSLDDMLALIRLGANPYVLAADMCTVLMKSVDQHLSFETVSKGVSKFYEDVEHALYESHIEFFENADFREYHSFLSNDVRDRLQIAPNIIKGPDGPQRIADEYRWFFLAFGEWLMSIEGLEEFSRDPMLLWFLFSNRAQDGLRMAVDPTGHRESDADRGLYCEEIWQDSLETLRHFKEQVAKAFAEEPDCKPLKSALDQLTEDLNKIDPTRKYIVLKDRYYEVWMESLTMCSCALTLLGRRHDSTWSRTRQIAEEKTQGYPSGVCTYRMAGDVYRRSTRILQEWDRRVTAESPFLIIHRPREPLLFSPDETSTDLTPDPYRQIGARYFMFYFVLFLVHCDRLRSCEEKPSVAYVVDKDAKFRSFPASVGTRWHDGIDLESLNEILEIHGVSTDLGKNFVYCILGVDSGVYSVFGSEHVDIPYTLRKTSDDYHRSFRVAYKSLLSGEAGAGTIRGRLADLAGDYRPVWPDSHEADPQPVFDELDF